MQPDESLDTLLTQRRRDSLANAPASIEDESRNDLAGRDNLAEFDDVKMLLSAADQFAVWGIAEPSPSFAERLEADLLARFSAPAEDVPNVGSVPTRSQVSVHQAAGDVTSPASGVERAANGAAQRSPKSLDRMRDTLGGPRRTYKGIPDQLTHFAWRAIAAAVLLVVLGTGGIAVVAANATPGQALYSVRRVEQDVRTTLASSPAERVRLHLQYAQDALTAFDAAVADRSGEATYRDALAAFAEEETDARSGLDSLPAGTERDSLLAELTSLRVRGRQDIRSALGPLALSWPLRADATLVLSQLGDSVLAVTHATISGSSQHGSYLWTITIAGSGFAPAAVVLVDGQPKGTFTSRSSTTLVAQVAEAALHDGTHTIGVSNPDGTVALILNVATNRAADDHGGGGHGGGDSGSSGSPTPPATPSGDDHGGSGGGSGSGSGGSSSGGSATPTPTSTPDDHH